MQTQEVFEKVGRMLKDLGFTIVKDDRSRPWGGFFVIEEAQAAQFAAYFFPDEDFEKLKISEKLSPKVLIVAPGKRLSWQYHHRRAEIWRSVEGEVGVVTSDTDEEAKTQTLRRGEHIRLRQGERHRLVGKDDWGVVAEIWQHIDATHPSDEEDIVRLQDDFGR